MTGSKSAASVVGVVLAAGRGTRMKSGLPKVLHELAGKSMLDWVLSALQKSGVSRQCVVLSEDLEGFEEFLRSRPQLTVVTQKNRQGTGDAVASAGFGIAGVSLPSYAAGRLLQGQPIEASSALICAGDVPAVRPELLAGFIKRAQSADAKLAVLGMNVPDPTGYGRMVVDGDQLVEIVEEKDASDEVRAIKLCNTGIIYANTGLLFDLLAELTHENSQKEYYLTDSVKLARKRGLGVLVDRSDDWLAFSGVNHRQQLARVEDHILDRLRSHWMTEGVTFRLPQSVYLEADVRIGPDTVLEPGVGLYGKTTVGKGVVIESHAQLRDAVVGDDCSIGSGSILERTVVPSGERIPALSVRVD